MGYRHITLLYKDDRILAMKECYALEKVNGTSANLKWDGHQILYSSGNVKQETFRKLFNEDSLKEAFISLGHENKLITIYGEAYGGSVQGMSSTYGKDLCFIAFEVKIDNYWLSVSKAEAVVKALNLEFVPYERGSAEENWINSQRDADSIVAIRRGMGSGKKREGVVLRPIFEITLNNGERLMAKHKRSEYRERLTEQQISAKLKVLSDAKEIAEEWVTDMRLTHVLQNIDPPYTIEKIPAVICAMIEDVLREAQGEIIASKEARKAISTMCINLYKKRLTKNV